MCEQSQAIQWTYRRRLLGAARSESGSRGRVPTQEPGTWTCPSHDAARQRHEPSSQSAHAYLRGRPGSPRNKCSGGATRRAPPTASSARKRRHDAERAGHHQPRDSGDPTRTPADTTTKRRRPHSAASPKNSSSLMREAEGAASIQCRRWNSIKGAHGQPTEQERIKYRDSRRRRGGATAARREYGRQQNRTTGRQRRAPKPCGHVHGHHRAAGGDPQRNLA